MVSLPNDVYDYLKQWDGWVPTDHHSQAKWVQDVAKRFDVSTKQAEEWITEYEKRKKGE